VTSGELSEGWIAPSRPPTSLRTSIIVDPPDGKLPPFTPAAETRVAARAEARKQHRFDDPEDLALSERCIVWGAGPPMLPTSYNSLFQIVQTGDHVVILNEMIHDARVIALDGRPHPPSFIRQLKGDSRGHWEGDTLVVDTTNFGDQTELRGTTAARHVVERFTRIDAETLAYQFTVDDPAAFVRPWSGELLLRRTDDRIFEYACHEANYSMELILRGARSEENR
jgi:hypothetical protein